MGISRNLDRILRAIYERTDKKNRGFIYARALRRHKGVKKLRENDFIRLSDYLEKENYIYINKPRGDALPTGVNIPNYYQYSLRARGAINIASWGFSWKRKIAIFVTIAIFSSVALATASFIYQIKSYYSNNRNDSVHNCSNHK